MSGSAGGWVRPSAFVHFSVVDNVDAGSKRLEAAAVGISEDEHTSDGVDIGVEAVGDSDVVYARFKGQNMEETSPGGIGLIALEGLSGYIESSRIYQRSGECIGTGVGHLQSEACYGGQIPACIEGVGGDGSYGVGVAVVAYLGGYCKLFWIDTGEVCVDESYLTAGACRAEQHAVYDNIVGDVVERPDVEEIFPGGCEPVHLDRSCRHIQGGRLFDL